MTEQLFRDNAYAAACSARIISIEPNRVVLDRTVFYPLGGGQLGATGALHFADSRIVSITDTRKGSEPGQVLQVTAPDTPPLEVGLDVDARLDWDRLYRLMRTHTCMHILCAAVAGAVTGGLIADGRGRLDFDLRETAIDKLALERKLNDWVASDTPVELRWLSDDELAARRELVRTMSVKPPTGEGHVRLVEIVGIDLQPCGGTHVRRTAEIGQVRVAKIESKGKPNKRITVELLS